MPAHNRLIVEWLTLSMPAGHLRCGSTRLTVSRATGRRRAVGATERELEAIFGWSGGRMATSTPKARTAAGLQRGLLAS